MDKAPNRLQSSFTLIRAEVSGARAMEIVHRVSRHHRIQASPGYRAAAGFCVDWLKQHHLHTQLVSYPANLDTYFFTQRMFKEWDCRSAFLEITTADDSQRMCDFALNDMSIIQRSAAVDAAGLEIVYVPDDVIPDGYHSDLAGKVLFVENGYERWIAQAIALGAAGIITVSMPEILPVRQNIAADPQMADTCANLSFHWLSADVENKLFGFALTPAKGERLRRICLALAKDGKRPLARAFVDASLYDGACENVMADIPGETAEEVLLLAHLCHPKSSVNDNVSGVAAAMEAIRSLQFLVDAGVLRRPKRTIRLVLVPEFTGTYAYLSSQSHRLDEVKAGMNLDLVGAKQDGNAGMLLAIDPPDAAHSFVGDLAALLLEELGKESPLGPHGHYSALFASASRPFMLGSDHSILCDPTVQVPTVALTQWPDKMYHTSGDNTQNIDSEMLRRTATLAAGYVYALASLETGDCEAIMGQTRQRIFAQLHTRCKTAADYGLCRELAVETCRDYLRFFAGEELALVQKRVDQEQRFYDRLLDVVAGEETGLPPPKAEAIPRRLFTAPLAMRSVLAGLDKALAAEYAAIQSDHSGCGALEDLVVYAMDGHSDVRAIAHKVQYETGVECGQFTRRFVDWLHQAGYVNFRTCVQ